MRARLLVGCLACFASWAALAGQKLPDRPALPVQLRRPIAAAFLDEKTLCVVNQRSGSLSLIDTSRSVVREEVVVGKHLTGLAVLPDRRHLLVTDDQQHELIVLAFEGSKLAVQARLAVGPYPASVAVLPDGSRATVASLWSHRLEVVDLATLRVVHSLRLPF